MHMDHETPMIHHIPKKNAHVLGADATSKNASTVIYDIYILYIIYIILYYIYYIYYILYHATLDLDPKFGMLGLGHSPCSSL